MERIVLAFSGGLDTSVAIPWLQEKHRAEVVTVTVDLGQGASPEDVRDRALAIGAARAHVIDARDEFARDFILPALQAGAMYEGRYPLATALGRPLIAKYLVEIAHIEGTNAVAHGCSGKGNGQVRMDISARALDPDIRVIAPAREWDLTWQDEIEYARQRGIPLSTAAENSAATAEAPDPRSPAPQAAVPPITTRPQAVASVFRSIPQKFPRAVSGKPGLDLSRIH